MRAILDTHVILWWVINNPQLSQAVRDIIADEDIVTMTGLSEQQVRSIPRT